MNVSRSNRKKALSGISVFTVGIILAAAVIFGFLYNLVAEALERRTYPRKYEEFVVKYAAEYGLPEKLIYSVIKTESDFDPGAVSYATPPALGLMQLTEETYEWVSSKLGETPSAFDIYDPDVNIRYGAWYLSYLYGRFDSLEVALAAYNAGPGNVSKWLESSEYSSDGETLDHIPFKETRNYVAKVTKAMEIYERLYYSK